MADDYLSRCVVDTTRRTVHIYSSEGDEKTVECDTLGVYECIEVCS